VAAHFRIVKWEVQSLVKLAALPLVANSVGAMKPLAAARALEIWAADDTFVHHAVWQIR